MKQSKIAILGAGLGGLTVAIALNRKGFKNITIYERRRASTTIGAGLVLWANASSILHKLNLLKEIKKVGGTLGEMQRWTEKGDFLGAINIQQINKSIGFQSYSISRKNLHEVLLHKVQELNIKIKYNYNANAISNSDSNSSSITFEKREKVQADIIIGADGRMDSMARKYVKGNNNPVYQNFVNWIGILETDKPIFSENNIKDFWGNGERFGIVPVNKHKVYWAGAKAMSLNSSGKVKNDKIELLQIFSSWPQKN